MPKGSERLVELFRTVTNPVVKDFQPKAKD
jgi:hypothetical protein